MQSHRVARFVFLFILAAMLTGCGGGQLPPLGLAEIPAAMRKAFESGAEENRALISGIAKQVEHQQFAPASFQLQNLLSDRRLTKAQKEIVARALVTINVNMQKQIDVQEAAVAPPNSPRARTTVTASEANSAPTPPADPAAAAEAATLFKIHQRTK